MARLEGHDDTKSLAPWSQFLAAGMGGIISQSAARPQNTLFLMLTLNQVLRVSPRHPQIVCLPLLIPLRRSH